MPRCSHAWRLSALWTFHGTVALRRLDLQVQAVEGKVKDELKEALGWVDFTLTPCSDEPFAL